MSKDLRTGTALKKEPPQIEIKLGSHVLQKRYQSLLKDYMLVTFHTRQVTKILLSYLKNSVTSEALKLSGTAAMLDQRVMHLLK